MISEMEENIMDDVNMVLWNELKKHIRQDRKRVGCVQLPTLFLSCPFFRKGFVSISISDHPLEIFVSLLLLAVGVVVFFDIIPHFGSVLFSSVSYGFLKTESSLLLVIL